VTDYVTSPGGPDWRASALCAQVDPELFFPDKGESARDALRVCAACEVRAACAAQALAAGERFGVWGGMTERTRRRQLATTRALPQADAGPDVLGGEAA
jgi:WhiB family redox-sensing transcriptional regulator